MTDANVRLVRSLYDAFQRGDIATIIGALTDDIDWRVHGNEKHFPTIGRWQGRVGVKEFFRLVTETEDMIEFSPQEFCAADNSVFVLGRYRWKVRKTGKPLMAHWCHVFTITSGKLSRFREFTDTAAFAESYRE
jgi:uncharacterized protein